MKEWSAQYDFSPLEVEVPRFCKSPQSEDGLDPRIAKEIDHISKRLQDVVCELSPMNTNGKPPPRWRPRKNGHEANQFQRLQDEFRNRDFWHRTSPKLYLPNVCDVHAAMWQRLHEWVEEKPTQPQRARCAFAGARAQAARLSNTSNGMWFVEVVNRRVHLVTSGDGKIAVTTSNGNSAAHATSQEASPKPPSLTA
jgi:hypothetical protein